MKQGGNIEVAAVGAGYVTRASNLNKSRSSLTNPRPDRLEQHQYQKFLFQADIPIEIFQLKISNKSIKRRVCDCTLRYLRHISQIKFPFSDKDTIYCQKRTPSRKWRIVV